MRVYPHFQVGDGVFYRTWIFLIRCCPLTFSKAYLLFFSIDVPVMQPAFKVVARFFLLQT